MPVLSLSLLGPFNACIDHQPIYNFRTTKVQALLIYLAVERDRPHPREALMTLLWPDMPLESAQVNLRQTIYRLRQAIPEINSTQNDDLIPLVLSDRQTVQLNPMGDIRVDLDEFQAHISSDPHLAVDFYRGNFLADFYLADSNEFEDWAENIREKLRRRVLAILNELTDNHIKSGEYPQAQTFAWRQLEIDPVSEPACRQLMLALSANGQRSAALSQYQIFTKRLKENLSVEPSKETQNLYKQIQADAQRQVKTTLPEKQAVHQQGMPVFLLTDIEDSTRLWDTHRHAMLSALLRHNAILEKQITNHGGRILELRGDGVKAVFENTNPLPCVLAIQKEFKATDWGEINAIKIRIGLHGVPAVRKDFDYFTEDDKYYGPVLNHTARIMDAGWGGQILVSEQVHQRFPLPPNASWHDYGAHWLKSLDQPVQIYGLAHPELGPSSFPPLNTLTTRQNQLPVPSPKYHSNLPPQSTPFVGRQQELADLTALLNQPETRLISIVGPGGMGKTRLTLAIAEQITEKCTSNQDCIFPDGVFFVPLASLNEPEQIIPTIAKAVNAPENTQSTETREIASQTTTNQLESLLGYLSSKRMLLILDNFEHLLPGVEIIANLLDAIPTLHMIASSRERLHIRGEQVYPIHGLNFPDQEQLDDPCKFTAMELFLQSAQRLRPDFVLEDDDFADLTKICRLVGGMPLGLELAASWVDMLSIKEIATEIQRSIDFLETDIRNVPDRHRSMRAVFDSSWNRLNKEERRIFPRLSIFRGTFTRPAAEEITQGSLRTLASLATKSLLQYDHKNNRYQIHELLRQYGEEQLQASDQDAIETQGRYSRFYCAEVERHMKLLMTGDTHKAIAQFEIDIANIQRALDWAIANGKLKNVDQAINGICFAYDWNWQAKEALAICRAVMDMLAAHNPPERDRASIELAQRLRAKILSWQGYFNLYFDHDLAYQLLEQANAITNQLIENGIDARDEKCQILSYQGHIHQLAGDSKKAKKCFKETLAISREIGQQWMELRCLAMLGNVARSSGEPREAKIWYEQLLAEARARKNPWGEINALDSLGWAARSLISYQEAQGYYQKSVELAKTHGNKWEVIRGVQSLGFLSIFLGQFKPGIEYFRQAVSIGEELGMPYHTLPCQIHIGFSHALMGEFDQAKLDFQKALHISRDLNPSARFFPIATYAEYLALMGRYQEAKEQIDFLDTLTEGIFVDRFSNGRIDRIQGWIALVEKKDAQARALLEESINLYKKDADDEQTAWSQAGLAAVAIHQNKMEEAKELLTEALWTSIEIQGFIPLLFTLPIVSLYLAKDNQLEKAQFVYTQLRYSPFLANAPLFEDMVYKHLPAHMIGSQSASTQQTGTDIHKQLWATASKILSTWIQVWMEDPKNVKSQN